MSLTKKGYRLSHRVLNFWFLQVAVMGQGSLGEVESIVSPVAEAVARELEPVQRGLTQAGAQVSASLNLCSV